MQNIKRIFESSKNVLVCAGAGMSQESGIPVFRGSNGLWTKTLSINGKEYSYQELLSHQAFEEQHSNAWDLINQLKQLYTENKPHKGYHSLRELLSNKNHFILTSNCDEYFLRAAFEEENILEIHGSIYDYQCLIKCSDEIWRMDDYINVPRCPECGGKCRPSIKMLGDWHWNSSKAKDQQRRYVCWMKEIKDNNESILVIEIGAGKKLASIREIAEKVAGEDNELIRINPYDYLVNNSNFFSIPKKAIVGTNDLRSS